MFPSSFVFVGGSRSLSPFGAAAAFRVGSVLAGRGVGLSVGCCRGADAAALSGFVGAGAAASAFVFAVGGPSGAGFWPRLVPGAVVAAAAAGASVRWWAGGPASVPGRARLVRRSRAAVSFGGSAVFVVGSPSSRGSFGAARFAAALGLPVFVVPVGFAAAAVAVLPSLGGPSGAGGPGAWVVSARASVLFGAPCFRWVGGVW